MFSGGVFSVGWKRHIAHLLLQIQPQWTGEPCIRQNNRGSQRECTWLKLFLVPVLAWQKGLHCVASWKWLIAKYFCSEFSTSVKCKHNQTSSVGNRLLNFFLFKQRFLGWNTRPDHIIFLNEMCVAFVPAFTQSHCCMTGYFVCETFKYGWSLWKHITHNLHFHQEAHYYY